MARKVRAGRMWIIKYEVNPPHAPSGGYKRSGFGIAVLLCSHLDNSEERKGGEVLALLKRFLRLK